MTKLNVLDWIALILVIIGGLNWGLVGIFNFDLIAAIFGEMSPAARIVYLPVGAGAIYVAAVSFRLCRRGTGSPEK